jgi:hypothetical protein
MKKQVELIPVIKADDLSQDVIQELMKADIPVVLEDCIIHMAWEIDEDLPKFKKWLTTNYKDFVIKLYDKLAISV